MDKFMTLRSGSFGRKRQVAPWLPLALCGAMFAVDSRAELLALKGSVGADAIVLELEDDGAYGRYFRESDKQDIPLRGEREAQTWRLDTDWHAYEAGDSTGKFVLARAGDVFTGTFTNAAIEAEGAALPVRLQVVAAGSTSALTVSSETGRYSDYEQLRLAGLRFIAGETQRIGERFQIQWRREALSGFELFHVVAGYPEAIMASINQRIDQDYYRNLSNYFGCSAGSGSGVEGLGASLTLLNERLLSYSISSSWWCDGAAHPDFGFNGTTIDAENGQLLALEDIYWLGAEEKPELYSDAWFIYHSDVFAPAIVALFQRFYPQEMKRGAAAEDCDYSDPEVWGHPQWYMTEQGLYLGAYFARAMRACDGPSWAIVPNRVLRENNPVFWGN
jgi:hypothetical protein